MYTPVNSVLLYKSWVEGGQNYIGMFRDDRILTLNIQFHFWKFMKHVLYYLYCTTILNVDEKCQISPGIPPIKSDSGFQNSYDFRKN